MFVVSGNVNSSREFWWDSLDRLLLLPTHLPDRLRVCVQAQDYEWPTASSGQRQSAYHNIRHLLRLLPAADRDNLVADVLSWAGLERTTEVNGRPMTAAELSKLTQDEHVELGPTP